MEVKILSKRDFDQAMRSNMINDENVESMNDYFFISITDTDKFSDSRIPYFKQNHRNVLNMSFDDCSVDGEPSPTQPEGTKAFTEQQAANIIQFIANNKDKAHCIVHCMAGISRSGAVGSFINDYYGVSYAEFKLNNSQISPNAHITRILHKVARHIWEKH